MLKDDLILFFKWAIPAYLFFYIMSSLVGNRFVLSAIFSFVVGVIQMTHRNYFESGKR